MYTLHDPCPVGDAVAHDQMEIVRPEKVCARHPHVIVEVGVAQGVTVLRQHVFAAVVAQLVTRVEAEARGGMPRVFFKNGGQILLALHVLKAQANPQLVGGGNDFTEIAESRLGGIMILKADEPPKAMRRVAPAPLSAPNQTERLPSYRANQAQVRPRRERWQA